MTAATATVAATAAASVAATTAAMLGKRGRTADQYRPQNAGCQKKAPALDTHDCHLQLPVARRCATTSNL
jgi:hypothetical protein